MVEPTRLSSTPNLPSWLSFSFRKIDESTALKDEIFILNHMACRGSSPRQKVGRTRKLSNLGLFSSKSRLPCNRSRKLELRCDKTMFIKSPALNWGSSRHHVVRDGTSGGTNLTVNYCYKYKILETVVNLIWHYHRLECNMHHVVLIQLQGRLLRLSK